MLPCVTFGLYVSSYDIWTNIAEKLLSAKSDNDFQILNNGLPGGTIYDYYQYLTEKGTRLKPEIVMLVPIYMKLSRWFVFF